ncbi:MAG TPA: metallophosphoesterase [Terriglobales bacterium]|nr:metallophosphoesterase [Terriglobales bacterium]
MPRNLVRRNLGRISLALLFLAALAALLIDTQSVAARPAADKESRGGSGDLVIAQLSDSHIGLARAPEASANLRKAVQMINQRGVDAVLVTGDVGERPEAWQEALDILGGLKAKFYMVPGNHDVSTKNVGRWRQMMGKDYDRIQIKNVTIYALDSQLLGNYDNYDAKETIPLPPDTKAESDKMLGWFRERIEDEDRGAVAAEPRGGGERGNRLVFAMQHVPISRADGFPADPRPYWTVQEPYRSKELDLLHKLGVKHMFVGHWHKGMTYQADGITYHVAPATSWSPFDAPLGFAIHTISPDGEVKSEYVNLQ